MKKVAVISLYAGIGDCVHIEPVLRHVLANGYDEVHLFCRDDAVGIYKHYPNVYDHPLEAKQLRLKLCRQGAVDIACGDAEHGVPGLHRTFQYAHKICPSLDIPTLDGEYPPPPVIPVTRQELDWGKSYFKAGEDQIRVLFQADSYRTSKSLPRDKANEILRRLATRNASVAFIANDPVSYFMHPNIRHVRALTVRQLMAVAAGADVALAMDSAPAWLSIAIGTPAVVAFGATSPSLYGYRTKLLRVMTTDAHIPCLFCNKISCGDRKCLSSIDTDRIMSAVRMLDCPTLAAWGEEPDSEFVVSPAYIRARSNGKINIGIILRVLARGGNETNFLTIADGLREMKDVRLKLIAANEFDSKFTGGREIHRVSGTSDRTRYESLYSLLDDNLDLVISYGDELPIAAASNLPNKAINVTEVQVPSPWHVQMITNNAPYLDGVVGSAPYVAEMISKDIADDIRVCMIPNCVDAPKPAKSLRTLLGIKRSDFVVGILARMVPLKGIGEAIESLSYLPDNVKLLLGGTGAYMKYYQRAAGIYRGRVHFLGWVEDKDSFFATIDAALLPSELEGNSIFLLESAMASLPLIVTPVGNVPYLFSNSESAAFVEKDAESIAQAIARLMADRAYASMLGANARQRVAEYEGSHRMAKMYYDLSKVLIGSNRA